MTYVDAHVHLYECFSLEVFLESLWENFQNAASGGPSHDGGEATFVCLLLDADGRENHPLHDLRDGAEKALPGDWTAEPTDEPTSLRLRRSEGRGELLWVAGRQVRTAERLEVLAIPLTDQIPHGLPLEDTIRTVLEKGALPVVPWALGKWWFGRGSKVIRLLRSALGPRVFVGDNGNRPRWSPRPRIFRIAASRQIPVLPGSDPLELPDHEVRGGAYGFCLPGTLARDRPSRDLTLRLQGLRGSPPSFGSRSSLSRCLLSNARLRMSAARDRA